MFTQDDLLEAAKQAKASTVQLRALPEELRRQSILAIKAALQEKGAEILAANRLDLATAEKNGLSAALIDRLKLDSQRLENLSCSLEAIAAAPSVLATVDERRQSPRGFSIERKRIPLGVIAVIFESRPNVLIDCAALAIKSGNAILLKGGSDAVHSNRILGEIVQQAIEPYLPVASVQLIPSSDRALTVSMVQLVGLIDLVIPRGGEGLIRMIQQHARIPVIAHAKGLCHLYLHADAKAEKAIAITLNAKTQRPGVCNALESLLVHRDLCARFLPALLEALLQNGVELRVDQELQELYPQLPLHRAHDEDWDTEYLDRILSIRLVANEDEAIAHILRHGSQHTEALISDDPEVQNKFEAAIDASCVMINASTRFNDGGELGLGAEIGISTSKLHAFGPMGARELTTTRFVVRGDGHCRD